jgi:hypothetical protein
MNIFVKKSKNDHEQLPGMKKVLFLHPSKRRDSSGG